MIWWLFALIELTNIPLAIAGWFICLYPPFAKWTWLWWNDDDGAGPKPGWINQYIWLAWRNPVDNFKHVKWTQMTNGPVVYKTWLWTLPLLGKRQFYYKFGWLSDKYCCLSAGGGRGF